MPLPEAARAHYATQQALARRTATTAAAIWAGLSADDLDRAWVRQSDRLYVTVSVAQQRAAAAADSYLADVLAEQGIDAAPEARVNARAFAGVASDGRDLESLLYQPVITTKTALAVGTPLPDAMATGQAALLRIVATQVQDAGRSAVGTAITSRRGVGWVRMLSTPSCARCAVLAGKFFRWNRGFQRHPLCDCVHCPSTEALAGDITTDPRRAIESGQVTGLSKADRQAILDGADPGQVINASRKGAAMTTASGAKATTYGTTRRALAGRRLARQGDTFQGTRSSRYRRASTTRLRPEAIYEQATDRDDALRLLHDHGYLV